MQFRLLHTEVPKLNFEKINKELQSQGSENFFNIKLNVFADKTREDVFGVLFKIDLKHAQEYQLTLDYLSWFETTENINPVDFLSSPFAQVNAPAIAFPFLRSFVSLLTLNSGFRPAILPTVNFMQMFEEQQVKI